MMGLSSRKLGGNARHGQRFPVKCLLSFKKHTDHYTRIYSALTIDLNLNGVSLFSSHIVEVGDNLRLWLLNGDQAQIICVDAQVKWTTIDDLYGDSAYWMRAGLKFVNVTADQERQLRQILPNVPISVRRNRSQKHLLAVLP